MGISSLGVGNSVLTQDVIDQLRKADEAGKIRPITLALANENDKQDALKIIDANMTNFIDSINEIKSATLWNERSATVSSGTSVEVSAVSNTDVQDFTVDIQQLATKQIEQSGVFGAATDKIDTVNAGGSFSIQVGPDPLTAVTISYGVDATLDDIKKLINTEAGDLVDASIVQLKSGEFHLMLSSDATGDTADTDIAMTSISGSLNASLTTFTDVQLGQNAQFTYNGGATVYERSSNKIDDLITGLTMTLKDTGVSSVSIAQDRTSILSKFDSFVEKYNATVTELNKQTRVSTESSERGIFSTDSSVKSMKRAIQNMLDTVGGGVASIIDYGFSTDKDGKMSLDKTVLEGKLDTESANTQAFFSGGDYIKSDLSIVTLTGSFNEMATTVEAYTKTNTLLDQLKESISGNISTFEDRKTSATERLDAKYEIMKKQFTAYGAIISRLNSASSMFQQMTSVEQNY